MKHNVTSVMALLLGTACLLTGTTACEKGVTGEVATTDTAATPGRVVITVGDIETGWDSDATRALVGVGEVCSRLNFAVYQGGSRVSNKNQVATDSDFGTYEVNLAEGSYQLLVLAHSSNGNPTYTNASRVQFTNPTASSGTGFSDTFYYYGDMTVSADGARVSVSMKRATAMFRLVTEDVKPAAVKKFQFYYEGGSGTLDATTGYGCVDSKQSVFVDTGNELTGQTLQMDMYTFLHDETGTVTFTVKAFDAQERVLYMREFSVPMRRNYITRYTGKLFTTGDSQPVDPEPTPEEPDPESSLVVKVDPEWGGIMDYTF